MIVFREILRTHEMDDPIPHLSQGVTIQKTLIISFFTNSE